MHKMLYNVFIVLSLAEAAAGLSLNSVNNTVKGAGGNKAKLSLGGGEERGGEPWRAVPKPLQVMYCVQKC